MSALALSFASLNAGPDSDKFLVEPQSDRSGRPSALQLPGVALAEMNARLVNGGVDLVLSRLYCVRWLS